MQFNSYSYLLFLGLAVVIFWSLPIRFRRPFVFSVSLFFYASWNVYFVILPILICVVIYVCATRMLCRQERGRFWAWCGVGTVVGVLAFFKYRMFLWENVSHILPLAPSLPFGLSAAIVLPLGISFYSFEAISYMLDTRQGRITSVSFFDLCLFVMFWPHLIAGPIVRARELFPQIKFDKVFNRRFVIQGLDRLIWGMVQKNFIANNIGPWVDEGFSPGAAALNTSVDNWFLAAAFGLQIYFDFAAYSNMAIGAAQMIGVTLPENFRYPFHAWNPSDFWSRWHMTLSRWIRDYLFFPVLAQFRAAAVPLYLSLLGVMSIVGLWHGAGWGFILWGTVHGAYLVIYRMFESFQEKRIPQQLGARWFKLAWRVFTLMAVTAAWIPFRAATLHQSWVMLSSMFFKIDFGHFTISYSINFYLVTLLVCLFCVVEPYPAQLVCWLDELTEKHQLALMANIFVLRPLVYACGLFIFIIFDNRNTQFIYFQF